MEECRQNCPYGTDVCLAASYSIAGSLVLFFFLCENCPVHRSRRSESAFITFALLSVWTASVGCPVVCDSKCWHELTFWDYATTNHVADLQVRQVMRLILIFTILQRLVWHQTKVYPSFVETRHHARQDLGPLMPEASPKYERISLELDLCVTKILDQISGRESHLSEPTTWGPALFGLLMLEDLSWSSETLRRRMGVPITLIAFTFLILSTLHQFYGLRLIGPKVARVNSALREIIQQQDKECLQYVLANVSVPTLMEVGGREMVTLLTDTALEAGLLSLLSKAILVDALQKFGIRFRLSGQEAVLRIMHTCKGLALTDLKHLVDGSGSYHNLFKLVYEDMSSRTLRAALLEHFEVQSMAVRKQLGGRSGVKVLSDIDDTLYSSGGRFPAGIDERLPNRMIYPGCLTLFRCLDMNGRVLGVTDARGEQSRPVAVHGPSTPRTPNLAQASHEEEVPVMAPILTAPTCNLVFLSARPHIYKDISEDRSYRFFRRLVEDNRLHSFPTLLPGRKRYGLAALLCFPCLRQNAWRAVGNFKSKTYFMFRSLYLEFDFIFCGDSGQGDLLAGQQMVAKEKSESKSVAQMLAVVIHEVLLAEISLAVEPSDIRGSDWRDHLRTRRVHLCRTYIAAALALHKQDPGLLSMQQVVEVAIDTVESFQAERWSRTPLDEGWLEAEEHVVQDLQDVEAYLHGARALDLVARLPKFQRSTVLTVVGGSDDEASEGGLTSPGSDEDDSQDHISRRLRWGSTRFFSW